MKTKYIFYFLSIGLIWGQTLNTRYHTLEEIEALLDSLDQVEAYDNIYNLEGFEHMGAHHHMGGTRMGIDKFNSVINKDLKVHDINNLYIGGSSSFVTSGYTNPTFTIVQLAIRLAKKINERLNA